MPNNKLQLIINIHQISMDRIVDISEISLETVKKICTGIYSPSLLEKSEIVTALWLITKSRFDIKEVFGDVATDEIATPKKMNRTDSTGAKTKI